MATQCGFLISKIKQIHDRLIDRKLNERQIDVFNGAQGRVLHVLYGEDNIQMNHISDKIGLSLPTLTGLIDRMEKSGLVMRQPCLTDRRKQMIVLTDKAKGLQEDYQAISEEMEDIFFQGFDADERRQFEDMIVRIKDNLEMADNDRRK
ncbi:MAG: MarR family transcriptional regulator [Erysipelotrichaceae bacterium]|nr:MarR family transcriptional regulator [Erysipelotrichaceae bacterium]